MPANMTTVAGQFLRNLQMCSKSLGSTGKIFLKRKYTPLGYVSVDPTPQPYSPIPKIL